MITIESTSNKYIIYIKIVSFYIKNDYFFINTATFYMKIAINK